MYSIMIEALREWSKTNDRHTKLQHTYGMLAILALVAAGLFSLINFELGQLLLSASFILAALFFINVIAWALIDAFLIDRLTKRPTKR